MSKAAVVGQQARARNVLFMALILLAPFSKLPSIALPLYNFTSFRIGLYQLVGLAFVLLSVRRVWQSRKKLLTINRVAVWLVALLGGTTVVGLVFAINRPRSLLLVASLLFLLLILLSGWYHASQNKLLDWGVVRRMMMTASIAYGVLSLVQLALATYTDSGVYLCGGCSPDVFGFPRVNVFAAEPLFWGNALLPFFFVALYGVHQKQGKLPYAALIASALAITLTFSRGAYAAVFFGTLVLAAIWWRIAALRVRELLVVLAVVAASVLVGFALLIASSVVTYPDAPYIVYNTTRGMLSHQSLGLIELPMKTEAEPAEVVVGSKEEFVSQGLVEASQNERLDSADLALEAWFWNDRTTLLGVGLGNLGPFVVANINNTAPDNLTVYIYYVLLLAEAGLIGLVSFVGLIYLSLRNQWRAGGVFNAVIAAIVTAFAVHFLFFGSYINVLYVWLWFGVALAAVVLSSPRRGGAGDDS